MAWKCGRCGRQVPDLIDRCRCRANRSETDAPGDLRWSMAAESAASGSPDAERRAESADLLSDHKQLDLFKVAVAASVFAIGMAVPYYYFVTLPKIRREEIRLQAIRATSEARVSSESSPRDPDASDEAVQIARDTHDGIVRVQRQLDDLRNNKPSEVASTQEPAGAAQMSSPPKAASETSASVPQVPVQPTMEQVAASAFGPVLQRTRRTTDQFTVDYRRYQESCEGKTTSGSWVLPLDPDSGVYVANTEINNETTPSCQSLLSDLIQSAETIRANIDAIEEAARVKGIWPGVVRDLYAKYGLGEVASAVHK